MAGCCVQVNEPSSIIKFARISECLKDCWLREENSAPRSLSFNLLFSFAMIWGHSRFGVIHVLTTR